MGGTGFIGEYLTKKLSNKENCQITIASNKKFLKSNSSCIRYIRLDLTKLSKRLEKLINSANIIVVLTQPNKKIIENLISTIKSDSCLKKIVYLSSALIYDNINGRQNEKSIVNPITDYERGKYEEERMLSKFIQGKDFKLCITRLANVYGNVKNRGLINHIFLSVLNNSPMVINGKGSSVRDYIFIDDVVVWLDFIIFWNQKNKKEIINICTGRGYKVNEVLETAELIIGKKAKVIVGDSVHEKKVIIGDNKKIINLSGIRLKYNLIEGLQQTYNNYFK